jgi:hypothetical protein
MGQIVKYKAQLVIKGCAQCSGFNYNKTYSLIVYMETIKAILVMVPDLNLYTQQMDVKGAYLNGILKEDIYMHQLEGYSNGTNKACKLTKMLYSLKQSRHKWNIQFNQGVTASMRGTLEFYLVSLVLVRQLQGPF